MDGQQAALLALIDLYCLDHPLLGLFPTASVHGFRNSSSAQGLHPIPGSCCGYIFFSPVFGFISCCSCLDPLRGPQDWFVTSLLEKPAASSLLCLPRLGAVGLLPGWWGYCSACAVVTLGPWLLFFSNTWPPVKKTAAGRAGKLKVLVIYLLGKTDAGHARCSEIIIFMTVGSRGSCHFGSFLCEALPVESVRESHKIALSREPMWMLGVWRRKQGSDLPVLQRKWNFLWKRKK